MKAYNKVANTMFTVCIHITMYTVYKVSNTSCSINVTLFLRVVLCFSSSRTLSRSSPTTSPTSTSWCKCTAGEKGREREGEGKDVKGKREGLGYSACQVGSFSFMHNAPCRQCNTALSHPQVTVHPSLPPSSHRQ